MRTILLYTALLFCPGIIKSQKAYMNIGGGYGFSVASQAIGVNAASNSASLIKGTFGKGINAGASFGYELKKHFALELGVNYITGSKYKITINDYHYYPETVNLKGKMLKLIPAIKMTIGENAVGYVRIGLVIGALNRISVKDEYYFYDYSLMAPKQNVTSTEVYRGGTPLGFNSAVGIEMIDNEHLSFFAEINSTSLSWAPKKSSFINYDINGYDQLSKMDVNQKEFEYVDKYDPYSVPTPSKPLKVLKSYYSYSNIALSFGIKVKLGKKKELKKV